MNKIFLSGNLTKDPEIRYTQSGKALARMGIAVSRRFARGSDNSQQTVDFFNLQAWERTAEFCQNYLKKGSRVFVEGRLQTYSYEGKDGTTKSGVDVVVENIEFGSSRRDESNGEEFGGRKTYSGNSNSRQSSGNTFDDDFVGEDVSDEDVPF